MLERIAQMIRDTISPQGAAGPSSTKLVWLNNGMASCYSATLATVGGVAVYVWLQKADPIYWGGVAALWVNALGFASSVQKAQHQATKEVTLAQATQVPGTQDKEGATC